MDYFSPGLRELARIAGRCRNRWRLRGARKHLDKAETELGLLGWQQAEFDPATQREVEKITQCEREQARLTNESAALAKEIAEISAQREQARTAFDQQRAPLATERAAVRESIDKSGAQVAAIRKQLAELERRIPQLEREARESSRLYNDLLAVEPQTPELRDQQAQLRERLQAIPVEIGDWQGRAARGAAEIEALQKTLAQETEREAALARELRELESAHAAQDREMADASAAKTRERERIEKESARLEDKKANPYLEIGRVLADSHLPPMNQPHVLDDVRASRLRVQEIEYAIAKSRADSDAEDRTLVLHSLILWGVIALALALVLGAL